MCNDSRIRHLHIDLDIMLLPRDTTGVFQNMQALSQQLHLITAALPNLKSLVINIDDPNTHSSCDLVEHQMLLWKSLRRARDYDITNGVQSLISGLRKLKADNRLRRAGIMFNFRQWATYCIWLDGSYVPDRDIAQHLLHNTSRALWL